MTGVDSIIPTVLNSSAEITQRIQKLHQLTDLVRTVANNYPRKVRQIESDGILGILQSKQGKIISFDVGENLVKTSAGLLVLYKVGIAANYQVNFERSSVQSSLISATEPSAGKIAFMTAYNSLLMALRNFLKATQANPALKPDLILLDGILVPMSILIPSPMEKSSGSYMKQFDNLLENFFFTAYESRNQNIPLVGYIKLPTLLETCNTPEIRSVISASDSELLFYALKRGEYTYPLTKPKEKPSEQSQKPSELSALEFSNYVSQGFKMYQEIVKMTSRTYGLQSSDVNAWKIAGEYYQHKWLYLKVHESFTIPVCKIQAQSWIENSRIENLLHVIMGDFVDKYGLPLSLALADLESRITNEDANEFMELVKSHAIQVDPRVMVEFMEKRTHIF